MVNLKEYYYKIIFNYINSFHIRISKRLSIEFKCINLNTLKFKIKFMFETREGIVSFTNNNIYNIEDIMECLWRIKFNVSDDTILIDKYNSEINKLTVHDIDITFLSYGKNKIIMYIKIGEFPSNYHNTYIIRKKKLSNLLRKIINRI